MIVFGYRNRTDNGTEKLMPSRKAAEAKIAALGSDFPHVEWELLEIEIKQTSATVWLPGRGRAGNSYRSSRTSNSIGKVKVLGVY